MPARKHFTVFFLLLAVFHGPIVTQSATCVRALVRIVGNAEVASRVASLNFSTDGLPVIRPESRFCCRALPTKISLLSAIPRSMQPCDLSLVERRRAARRWPCSEPRHAYEPARLYQRNTRNAAAAPAQQAMFPRGSTEQSRGAPPILFAETLL